MSPLRRWLVTLVVVGLVVALPLAPRLLPAQASDVSAADLLAQVRASPDQGWSGLVETAGTLQLPASGELDDLGALLGEQTRMRVWWRGPDAWRVDRLLVAGEDDLVHRGSQTVDYSYEAQEARVSADPDIRLPRTVDLLPNELARRLLDGADPASVQRLPARRVAGLSAPGLRLAGAAATRSTIARVDLWADPATGVPLRLEVWARGADAPSFTTAVVDYDADRPPRERVTFEATATTEVRREEVLDIADAANQYAPFRPPSRVAGLASTDATRGAVGVYGAGLRQLIAIPLRGSEAGPLRRQIAVTPGATSTERSIGATVGPLGLLLGGRGDDGGWLVAGTLTQQVLQQAVDDLVAGTVYVEERDR